MKVEILLRVLKKGIIQYQINFVYMKIEDLNLTELSPKEKSETFGGDKFLRDLGDGIGTVIGFIGGMISNPPNIPSNWK